jgi:hypothetical protein
MASMFFQLRPNHQIGPNINGLIYEPYRYRFLKNRLGIGALAPVNAGPIATFAMDE